MSGDGHELLRWLPGLLSRKAEDGSYRYSDREVLDFLAVFLIEIGYHPSELGPELTGILGGFARRAQVPPEADPEEAKACIVAYLEANPIPTEMSFELRRGLREGLAIPRDEAIGEAFRSFMATTDRQLGALLDKPRPDGTIPGGPMARFMAMSRFEK